MFLAKKPDYDYLRKNRQRPEYDVFFRHNPLPMFIYSDSTLKFLDVNLAAVQTYGYNRSEFLSMTVKDIRPQEDVKLLTRMFKENQSEQRVTGYWRHKRKDGSIIFVEVYSQKIDYPPYNDARVVTAFDVTRRKLVEENLSRSEQRFRELTEMLPQIIFEIDLEGNLLYCNQKAFETFKYPPDTDISTINVFSFISPSQFESAKEDLSKVLTGEKIENREYVLSTKDGTSFTAIIIVSPIIHDQKPAGFRGVIIDVSKLKNVHQELLYSQKKYSSLFENAYSIMMIIDPETRKFVDANKAAANFYGYSIDEMKQLQLTDIIPISEEELTDSLSKAVDFKQNQFIRQHRLANGSYRFVEVFTSPIFINGKNFLFSVIHDIQDRILAEKNLKKLNKAIEHSPVSVVITDCDGNIEYVNPKFCELTGYSWDEVIGGNPKILNSGEQDSSYYKDLWTTISSGKNWYGEFKNKKKDGSFYWESASISPLFDEQGYITHYVAIKEDITERKLKEAELLHAKEVAEDSDRLKSNFLANMSHELRTPLVGILGYADILSNELNSKEHKEMAGTILQSGQQLIETLNSILDLSRIEANKNELEIKTYDLREILNESYFLYKPVAKSRNLSLRINVPSQNLFIDADRHVLSKIFNNLINNALKFTLNGGVTISADVIVDGKELLIKTDVTDTGIGIPEKFQKVIFEPFRQASEGLSRNYTGTGLGLTLTRKFVELINGSISVESKEGSGSTFSVTLPFSKSGEQFSGESDISRTSAKLKLDTKPSLLLVEDDLVNAQIVIAYLRPFFEIDHVEDGQSGIDLCKVKTYDTVLMDIALKGINGTVTMQEIKKLSEHYIQIPFVAITAYAMLGDRESFLGAGFSYYISKPFTRTQLFEVLTQIFKEKSI